MPAEVAIIGAGPAGLATAACLRARGIAYRLFDRTGLAGGAYREIYAPLQLASPTKFTVLPGLPHRGIGEYITASQYRDYLDRYAAHHELKIEAAEVTRIVRPASQFELVASGSTISVRAVVIATGMWSSPRAPSIQGDSIPVLHARDWRGPGELPPGDLIIVGGATAAVEIAEEAARAGRRVHVVARSGVRLARQRVLGRDLHDLLPLVEWIPVWAARGFCARPPTLPAFDLGFKQLRKAGNIVVHTSSLRVDNGRAILDDGRAVVDGGRAPAAIVLATGYRFDTPFVPPEVERAPGGHLRAKHTESVSWPNLFVVGAPCAAGLASEFLRGIARDAETVASVLAIRGRSWSERSSFLEARS